MDGDYVVALFAIAMPFIFGLAVIYMVVKNKGKKNKDAESTDTAAIEEIYRGLKDLNKRIDNLETLHRYRGGNTGNKENK